jgi:hypothetical protein
MSFTPRIGQADSLYTNCSDVGNGSTQRYAAYQYVLTWQRLAKYSIPGHEEEEEEEFT